MADSLSRKNLGFGQGGFSTRNQDGWSEATFKKHFGEHHHWDKYSNEEDTVEEESSVEAQLQQLPGDSRTPP